jgi:hypothetical protein
VVAVSFVQDAKDGESKEHLKPYIIQGKTITLVKLAELSLEGMTHYTHQEQPRI